MACYTVENDLNLNNTTELTDETSIVDDLTIVPLEKNSFGKYLSMCRRP